MPMKILFQSKSIYPLSQPTPQTVKNNTLQQQKPLPTVYYQPLFSGKTTDTPKLHPVTQVFTKGVQSIFNALDNTANRGELAAAWSNASTLMDNFATQNQCLASMAYTLIANNPDHQSKLESSINSFGTSLQTDLKALLQLEQETLGSTQWNKAFKRLSKNAKQLYFAEQIHQLRQNMEGRPARVSLEQLGTIKEATKDLMDTSLYREFSRLLEHAHSELKLESFSAHASTTSQETFTLTPAIYKALEMSVKYHQTQKRRDRETPYFSHVLDVAANVLRDDGTEAGVIAALLHDAPEDQGGTATLENIRDTFNTITSGLGDTVASIILDCSQKWDSGQDWDSQEWLPVKLGYINHIKDITNTDSLLIILHDKTQNLRTALRSYPDQGSKYWNLFYREGDDNASKSMNRQIWFYQAVLSELEKKLGQTPSLITVKDVLQQLKRAAFNDDADIYPREIYNAKPEYRKLDAVAIENASNTPDPTNDGDGRIQQDSPLVGKELSAFARLKQQSSTNTQKSVHIVTGLIGSGKSHLISPTIEQAFSPLYYATSDRIKEQLDGYHLSPDDEIFRHHGVEPAQVSTHNGLGATAIHRDSTAINNTILEKLIEQGDNFAIEHTGRCYEDDIHFIKRLKGLGYQVFLHHVETPTNIAIDRSIERFDNNGRFPPVEVIAKKGMLSTDNFLRLRKLSLEENLLDGYSWHYNGSPGRELPVLIDSSNITLSLEHLNQH